MRKALTILAVIGLVGSVAAGELLVARYSCNRDNFNDQSNGLKNHGTSPDGRWIKPWEYSIYYGDWSEDDLNEIWEMVTLSAPPAPYTGWEVRYATTGVNWAAANPTMTVWFGAFLSETDWVEGNGDKNQDGDGTGASDDYAQCSQPAICGPASIDWVRTDTGGNCDFRDLRQHTNSVPFVGFVPSIPLAVDTNQAPVDLGIGGTLDVLVNDPLCRGLRAGVDGTMNMDPVPPQGGYNEGVFALNQWGGIAAGALLVYAVPEPASLLLLAFGGVGLLLRRKR